MTLVPCPPQAAMSDGLKTAIDALDPAAVAASLAANADLSAIKDKLVYAFCSWTKARRGIMRGSKDSGSGLCARFGKFMRVAEMLLDAGAAPRGMVPPAFTRDLCLLGGDSGCALPLEAAACLMEAVMSEPFIVLLRKHGSRLDGLCDGSCKDLTGGIRCGALSCSLRCGMASLPPEISKNLDDGEATVVSPSLVAFLVQSGAGSVVVDSAAGRLTAAQAALFFAIIYNREHVVKALLAAGVSGDFNANGSCALWAAVEEATNESLEGFREALPDVMQWTREVMLRLRIHQRSKPPTNGPAWRILGALLAAGCPGGLSYRRVSAKTGAISSIFVFPVQLGALQVVKALLAAGGDPDALASEADPAPTRRPEGVETPLEVAASWGHLDVLQELLRAGAKAGRSPRALASAAREGFVDIVEALLAAPGGRDILEQECVQPVAFNGMTPLMAAALGQQPAAVDVLLAAGANAKHAGQAAVLAAQAGGDLDNPRLRATPMACAIFGGASPDVIDALVAAGATRPVLRTSGSGGVTYQGSTGRPIGDADAGASHYRLACDACGKQPTRDGPPLMLCGRCKVRRYCSVACQRAAWKDHKDECKALQAPPQASA